MSFLLLSPRLDDSAHLVVPESLLAVASRPKRQIVAASLRSSDSVERFEDNVGNPLRGDDISTDYSTRYRRIEEGVWRDLD
jgi:hypothetical protein